MEPKINLPTNLKFLNLLNNTGIVKNCQEPFKVVVVFKIYRPWKVQTKVIYNVCVSGCQVIHTLSLVAT